MSNRIASRIAQPTPAEIRLARARAGLSQTEAAALVSTADKAAYKTWAGYEQPVGNRNHRAIPLAAWGLFLLLTGQHPTHLMVSR
jgi:DNA-binding XRE family transcriptional regulator